MVYSSADIRKYEPLFGDWKAQEPIGQGTYGTVYRVTRDVMGQTQTSAVKLIQVPSPEQLKDAETSMGSDRHTLAVYFDEMVSGIVREIQLLDALSDSANVVSYKDHKIIQRDGIGWDILIRMEYLTPLRAYIAKHPLSREQVGALGLDILSALEVCQRKGIIHRDIKDDNIFVNGEGVFKLGDFGIARQMTEGGGTATKRMGTSWYMAPEVYRGERYDSRADIYSLGIVLYRLLNSERMPFVPQEKPDMAFERRMRGDALPLPENARDALGRVVLKACTHRADDRYATAAEMKGELAAALVEIRTPSEATSSAEQDAQSRRPLPGRDEGLPKTESFFKNVLPSAEDECLGESAGGDHGNPAEYRQQQDMKTNSVHKDIGSAPDKEREVAAGESPALSESFSGTFSVVSRWMHIAGILLAAAIAVYLLDNFIWFYSFPGTCAAAACLELMALLPIAEWLRTPPGQRRFGWPLALFPLLPVAAVLFVYYKAYGQWFFPMIFFAGAQLILMVGNTARGGLKRRSAKAILGLVSVGIAVCLIATAVNQTLTMTRYPDFEYAYTIFVYALFQGAAYLFSIKRSHPRLFLPGTVVLGLIVSGTVVLIFLDSMSIYPISMMNPVRYAVAGLSAEYALILALELFARTPRSGTPSNLRHKEVFPYVSYMNVAGILLAAAAAIILIESTQSGSILAAFVAAACLELMALLPIAEWLRTPPGQRRPGWPLAFFPLFPVAWVLLVLCLQAHWVGTGMIFSPVLSAQLLLMIGYAAQGELKGRPAKAILGILLSVGIAMCGVVFYIIAWGHVPGIESFLRMITWWCLIILICALLQGAVYLFSIKKQQPRIFLLGAVVLGLTVSGTIISASQYTDNWLMQMTIVMVDLLAEYALFLFIEILMGKARRGTLPQSAH